MRWFSRDWVLPSLKAKTALFQMMLGLMIYLALATWVVKPPPDVIQAQMIELGVIASLLGVSYFYENIKLISQVLILSMYGFTVVVASRTGGIHAITLDWLGVIPSCTLLLGSATVLTWGALSLLIVIGMAFGVTDTTFFQLAELPSYSYWGALNLLAMLTGFGWFVVLYEEINNRNLQQLESQKNELTNTQTQLIEARSHKDEFIAVVSHELRTPLNAVLGFTDLLRDSVSTSAQKIIEQIRFAAFDLLQIISDILDFSQLQIHRVKLIYDRIYPDKLIHSAAKRFAIQAQRKGLTVGVTIGLNMPQTVLADEYRLTQVLDQLLSNAIKFSDVGQITITASGDEANLFIDIADQGIGIDPRQLDSIFDGFQHATAEVQHRYGGTGLGLAICKKIIQLHQGQISVKSELGCGAVFRIVIPAAGHEDTASLLDSEQAYTAGMRELPVLSWVHRVGQRVGRWQSQFETPEKFFMLIVTAVSASMIYYSITAPFEEGVWLCAGISLGFFLAGMLVAIDRWVRAAVMVITVVSIAGIVGMSLYEMGIFSPTAAWLTILISLPLYMLKRQEVLKWAIVVALTIVSLSVLTAQDVLLWNPQHPVASTLWSASGHISIMSLMIVLPLIHKIYRLRGKSQLMQQNEALEQVRQELLAQHQLKDQFIATVTHALRTPMNFIIGFNDLLKDEIKDHLNLLTMQEMVSQSAQHLLTVIDDILDYSQLMTGQVKLKSETFDLPKAITHAFQMFGATQHHSSVELSLELGEIPRWVNGDVQRLTQILVNLLSNALKFTSYGKVVLNVSQGLDGVEFVVIDTGVGIAEEKIEQIFEQFEQANQRKNRRQGHGLGLSITRRLIRAQNGWIRVNSKLGQGTQFTFNLKFDVAEPPQSEVPTFKPAVQSQQGTCILVVDDQPLNRTLVKAVLSKVWPDVVLLEAIHGLDALEKVQSHSVNLILMDMLMPEMDGVSATIKIRRELPDPICDIPVIGLTANANESTRQQCLQAGMNEIIYKPFNRDELVECIEMLLGRMV